MQASTAQHNTAQHDATRAARTSGPSARELVLRIFPATLDLGQYLKDSDGGTRNVTEEAEECVLSKD